MKEKMVLVTTDKDRRGVFMGELVDHNEEKATVKLKNAQMCVMWSIETRGVFGLASIGPQSGSRVTPIVKEIFLDGVTSVTKCTKKAVKQWRTEIWD